MTSGHRLTAAESEL